MAVRPPGRGDRSRRSRAHDGRGVSGHRRGGGDHGDGVHAAIQPADQVRGAGEGASFMNGTVVNVDGGALC